MSTKFDYEAYLRSVGAEATVPPQHAKRIAFICFLVAAFVLGYLAYANAQSLEQGGGTS